LQEQSVRPEDEPPDHFTIEQERNMKRSKHSILLIDMKGNVAIVPAYEIHRTWANRIVNQAKGALVVETGEVLKDCAELSKYKRSMGTPVPEAHAVFGFLKGSKKSYGDKAIRFRLGYQAANGFSVPLMDTLQLLYEVEEKAAAFGS
jgi:hypothetical protein